MLAAAVALTALFVVAALLPLLPLAHGIVRVGDFPRQQFLALALAVLAASLAFGGEEVAWRIVQLLLLGVVIMQAWYVLPYTPLWRKESAEFDPASSVCGSDMSEPLRLLACNVKMSNRNFAEMTSEIARHDPDLFVLMEVDERWYDALADLLGAYPHVVAQPQENSYGMVLASKFPLSDTRVECLLTDGVPSIVTVVTMPGGLRFKLYSIHPEPPVPHRGTEGRDGETALVALKVREETMPVIVTGDLNDVAWSRTTARFRRISRLLDPRIGRKVFSTFDARYPLIRWPLDHLFHSAEFRLKAMSRLPASGSDHFPVLFDLVLCRTEEAESTPEQANGRDMERARDLVDQARKRDEKPIGSDWEQG